MEQNNQTTPESPARVFAIKVTEDRMRVLLSCRTSDIDLTRTVKEINEDMRASGIRAKFNEAGLIQILTEAAGRNEDLLDFVIARGNPATESKDGRLDWQGEFFNEGYFVDPVTKRIDFHRKAGDPSCTEGQVLVKVFNGLQGKNGIDVYGKSIEVPRAKLIALHGGQNVLWDEKENCFRAKKAGRVRLRGTLLDVDETYFVPGGINNNTGNIKHNGTIVINGDIDADFVVEATGDIEIRGLVYASEIKCGGNLIAKEGINENPAKKVHVKGDILAKYIMNANIECEGQVIVNREIFQSEVKSRTTIHCKDGRIVGAEVMAAKGIYVNEAGSKGDIKTTLITGIDFFLQRKIKENIEKIEGLKANLGQLKPVAKKLEAMYQYLKPEQKEALTELKFKIDEVETGIQELDNENKEIRKDIYSNKNAKIVIMGMVYPGTVLRVFDSQFVVENALAGPIVAGIDPITGEIGLSSELKNVG